MRACRKGEQNYSTGISEPLTAALPKQNDLQNSAGAVP